LYIDGAEITVFAIKSFAYIGVWNEIFDTAKMNKREMARRYSPALFGSSKPIFLKVNVSIVIPALLLKE